MPRAFFVRAVLENKIILSMNCCDIFLAYVIITD